MSRTHPTPSSAPRPLHVAIVGSGPAGFYAAEAIAKRDCTAFIDMFERLPTPYGLVRGGVAPDHQKIKQVAKVYARRAEADSFRFFGNVALGRDIEVEDLRRHYDVVIYAVGGERGRKVSVPGIELPGSHSAPAFVGWYNGHPDHSHRRYDHAAKRVAVVGNGNVAIDVARVLCRTPEELAPTDIADDALDALRTSQLEEVFILGRRGPLQSSFTPKELGELGELAGADVIVNPSERRLDAESVLDLPTAEKHRRRNLEKLATISRAKPRLPRRALHFRFLVSPEAVLADMSGRVCGLHLRHNELVRDEHGDLRPRATDRTEVLDVGMVIWAVGYRGSPIEGVPFDDHRGVIENDAGRVTQDGMRRLGEYVVGWAGTGAQGLIGAHKASSAAVVDRVFEDLDAGVLPTRSLPPRTAIEDLLEDRDVHVVRFADWKRLDQIERERGSLRSAPRSKLTSVSSMLTAMRPRTQSRRLDDWERPPLSTPRPDLGAQPASVR